MKKLVLLAIFATTSFLTTLPAHADGSLVEGGWGKLPESLMSGPKEPQLPGGNGGATGRPNK